MLSKWKTVQNAYIQEMVRSESMLTFYMRNNRDEDVKRVFYSNLEILKADDKVGCGS